MRRLTWEEYFMNVALDVAKRSSCLSRQVGAVIVKDKRILATGYNGMVSGVESCCDKGYCIREGSKSGENLNTCYAVHAEENAILQCAKFGTSSEGATLYVTCKPCSNCMKSIIQAGIKKIIYLNDYNSSLTDELVKLSNIECIKYSDTE